MATTPHLTDNFSHLLDDITERALHAADVAVQVDDPNALADERGYLLTHAEREVLAAKLFSARCANISVMDLAEQAQRQQTGSNDPFAAHDNAASPCKCAGCFVHQQIRVLDDLRELVSVH